MVIVAASFSRSSEAPEHMAAHVSILQWCSGIGLGGTVSKAHSASL